MKYLGIDYGTKRVGLAVSDDRGSLAFPKEILKNDNQLLENIEKVIEREDVGEIVIGHSLNNEGGENKLMEAINDLIGQLSITTMLPIHLQDERFTSDAVRKTKIMEGSARGNVARKSKSGDPEHTDAKAAAVILQRFLDK